MIETYWWKRGCHLALVVVFILVPLGAMAQVVSNAQVLERVVQEAYDKFKGANEGATADDNPELAKVPAERYGVGIVAARGDVYTVGDVDYAFSIRSMSKPFTAALVMQEQGSASVIADKIGVEPTGLPFSSIRATQILKPVSVNPSVKSGAIALLSMVEATNPAERFNKIFSYF